MMKICTIAVALGWAHGAVALGYIKFIGVDNKLQVWPIL
jgi:hypothetical protein